MSYIAGFVRESLRESLREKEFQEYIMLLQEQREIEEFFKDEEHSDRLEEVDKEGEAYEDSASYIASFYA